MRALQLLLTLCGALAVLTLGALSAGATPSMPACHEMSGQPAQQTPDQPLKVMGCCVVCVTAPIAPPADAEPASLAPSGMTPRASDLRVGLTPAPEPGPPRV